MRRRRMNEDWSLKMMVRNFFTLNDNPTLYFSLWKILLSYSANLLTFLVHLPPSLQTLLCIFRHHISTSHHCHHHLRLFQYSWHLILTTGNHSHLRYPKTMYHILDIALPLHCAAIHAKALMVPTLSSICPTIWLPKSVKQCPDFPQLWFQLQQAPTPDCHVPFTFH